MFPIPYITPYRSNRFIAPDIWLTASRQCRSNTGYPKKCNSPQSGGIEGLFQRALKVAIPMYPWHGRKAIGSGCASSSLHRNHLHLALSSRYTSPHTSSRTRIFSGGRQIRLDIPCGAVGLHVKPTACQEKSCKLAGYWWGRKNILSGTVFFLHFRDESDTYR
jgi:hypothetical protein